MHKILNLSTAAFVLMISELTYYLTLMDKCNNVVCGLLDLFLDNLILKGS